MREASRAHARQNTAARRQPHARKREELSTRAPAVLDRVQQHLGVEHMEDLWLVADRHGRRAAARIPRVLLAEERRLRHLTSATRQAE